MFDMTVEGREGKRDAFEAVLLLTTSTRAS